MTVSSTTRQAGPFTGTGANATLAFGFKVFATSDIQVTRNGTTLTLTSDYTVSLNADQDASPGGTVTILAAANTIGAVVYVGSAVPATQSTSLPSQTPWYPKVVETALDKLTILIQQTALNTVAAAVAAATAAAQALINAVTFVVTSATGQAVSTRTLLGGIASPVIGQIAYLTEAGRQGWFEAITTDAAAVTSDPGQGIYVAGSGVTWRRINSDILNVKWFGAKGDNSTDDTTPIQAAINYACLLNVIKLFFPAGRYVVTNLSLPALANTAASMKVIEFYGVAQPSTIFGTVIGGTVISQSGSIIRSTATSGAILGVTANAGSFSFYHLVTHDLNFRATDNPQVVGIDAGWALQFSYYNLQLDTGVHNLAASLPTHTNAVGIITPKTGNGALTYGRNVVISGFYVAMDVNEHTDAQGITFNSCLYAMRFQAANEATLFGRVQANYCPTVIAVNGVCRSTIQQLSIEHAASDILIGATSWMAPVEDIRDVTNVARMTIGMDLSAHNVGTLTLDNLVFNGGTGIHVYPAGGPMEVVGYHTITNPAAIPTGGAGTNVTWTGGTGNDSGLKIKGGDATKLQCIIPGLYEFQIRGSYAANATGNRQLILGVNAAAIDSDVRPNAGASLAPTPAIRAIALLAKLDEVTVAGLQDSGVSLNLTCSALAHKRIAANFAP
jgi:hypothetical protein